MTTSNDPRPWRGRRATFGAVLCATVLGAGPQAMAQTPEQQGPVGQLPPHAAGQQPGALPPGGAFQLRAEAAVQYVSNLTLAQDSSDQVDMAGLELAPGFSGSYSTRSVVAIVDYTLIARAWEDSDYDDISHRLGANGQWHVIPEWISVLGQASYLDAVIDPRNGINYGGLGIFGPGNLTEVASASVSPVLQHRFNRLEVTARYSYGQTWYLDEGRGDPLVGFNLDQDSRDQSAGFSLGTADTGSRVSASVFYDWQKSEYENSFPYQYERTGVEAGYEIGRTVTLIGDIGRESDLDVSTTEGGLDSDFWSAGLRWDPSDRTSAEGRVGERFFGNSWMLSITHRARLLVLDASYSEDPNVETQTVSIGEFTPGELPPALPGVGIGRFNSQPYVSRQARASIRADGSRTSVSLSAYQEDREYLDVLRDDEVNTGVRLGVTRDLASNLSAEFELQFNDYERTVTTPDPTVFATAEDRDTQAMFRLNRASGPRLTLIGEAGYLTRSGEDDIAGDQDYDGWWLGLRARWTP